MNAMLLPCKEAICFRNFKSESHGLRVLWPNFTKIFLCSYLDRFKELIPYALAQKLYPKAYYTTAHQLHAVHNHHRLFVSLKIIHLYFGNSTPKIFDQVGL